MKADYYTTVVRTGSNDARGISMLVIPRNLAGIETKRASFSCVVHFFLTILQIKTSGWWASNTALVTFDNVKVPKNNLIGQLNHGFLYTMFNFSFERLGMAIQGLRYSRVCLEDSIAYARKRKTFGKRLIDHQGEVL